MAASNLFQQYLQPPKSAIEYSNEYEQADALRNRNALQALTLQQQTDSTQQALQERNALRRIAGGWSASTTPEEQAAALRGSGMAGLMGQADTIEKNAIERTKGKAVAAKDTAEAAKAQGATLDDALKRYRSGLDFIDTPQGAARWVTAQYQDPLTGAHLQRLGPVDQLIARIPQDPAGFQQWRQQAAVGMDKFIDNQRQAAQQVETVRHNKADEAGHLQGIRMQQAGENLRAGMTPGGGVSPDMETTAQAIASGQLPPPTGMALTNPRNQRVLARVMEINPQYDFTSVTAKKKAASDFTSGPQGNAMRSFQVAGQHLDQLGTLVDALDNGNMQIVNKIGNWYSERTGNPAPTNFDAAKDVVSKEVVKAIVAGGGGVSERQELSELMSKAKSPAQLKGVITQYRNLMGAQHDALLQQRRAAGLSDSTLPNYNEAGGAPAPAAGVPDDIAAILKKHGGK